MQDPSPSAEALLPWKILIADDDRDVHSSTRFALRGIHFKGRPLTFLHAYSGAETLTVLQENPDTALVFLDIIMETEDAGLNTAQHIREMGFNLVRIIFRTGFPGQAPEQNIVENYDVHDYKDKSGLTAQKLHTALISALRAYDDLGTLENHRRGLLSVLELGSSFDFNDVQRYVARMLAEFVNLAKLGADNILVVARSSTHPETVPQLIAAQGTWQTEVDHLDFASLPTEVMEMIHHALNKRQSSSNSGYKTLLARHQGIDLVLFAQGERAFECADDVLLEVFLINVCQTLNNQNTFASMSQDRHALFRGMALQAEQWDEQAASSFQRLSHLVLALAKRLDTTLMFPDEIDSRFLHDIGIAALLHDLGNATLPKELLLKESVYTASERQQMQEHVAAGLQAIRVFETEADSFGALHLAKDIIRAHHEHVDGSGYPAGLQGENIPFSARLFAVADTYIALTSKRPHRAALDSIAARAAIQASAGQQFDPRIVQALFELFDDGYIV